MLDGEGRTVLRVCLSFPFGFLKVEAMYAPGTTRARLEGADPKDP
jgi:hypothetical protein